MNNSTTPGKLRTVPLDLFAYGGGLVADGFAELRHQAGMRPSSLDSLAAISHPPRATGELGGRDAECGLRLPCPKPTLELRE